MKRLVRWEKYIEPLGSNLDEVEFPGYDELPEDDSEYDDSPKAIIKPGPFKPPNKVIHTPFGFLSFTEHILASSQFDFWILHTNFNLTPLIVNKIEQVPGVETLDVLTRYRARIGIPKTSGLFTSEEVKLAIQKAILEFDYKENILIENLLINDFTQEVVNLVQDTVKKINRNNEYWGMYILPNGQLDITLCNNNKELQEKLNSYSLAMQNVGGMILTYQDYR